MVGTGRILPKESDHILNFGMWVRSSSLVTMEPLTHITRGHRSSCGMNYIHVYDLTPSTSCGYIKWWYPTDTQGETKCKTIGQSATFSMSHCITFFLAMGVTNGLESLR